MGTAAVGAPAYRVAAPSRVVRRVRWCCRAPADAFAHTMACYCQPHSQGRLSPLWPPGRRASQCRRGAVDVIRGSELATTAFADTCAPADSRAPAGPVRPGRLFLRVVGAVRSAVSSSQLSCAQSRTYRSCESVCVYDVRARGQQRQQLAR